MSHQLLRRDLRPGDVFVFLDSAPWSHGSTPTLGYGTVLVAAELDGRSYANHTRWSKVPGAIPHPRPGSYISDASLDRPVMLLRFVGEV